MIFHPRHKDISHVTLEPTLNGDKIERIDNFNFLGVLIDKHISWKYHTEMSSNKISKNCGVLSRLKNYLPLFILRTIYFSMVHSHLNYGLFAWGFDSNRIIKLQKRCVRIITRSRYNAHTQPLMKQLNILSVPDMLLLNSMKFYYKYMYKRNEVPDYFPLSTYTHKAQLTTTTPAWETISGQIECASISLKNVFKIISRMSKCELLRLSSSTTFMMYKSAAPS